MHLQPSGLCFFYHTPGSWFPSGHHSDLLVEGKKNIPRFQTPEVAIQYKRRGIRYCIGVTLYARNASKKR